MLIFLIYCANFFLKKFFYLYDFFYSNYALFFCLFGHGSMLYNQLLQPCKFGIISTRDKISYSN